MKRGILLEKNRGYWLVLTNEGEFKKVSPRKIGEIGEEVSLGYSWNRVVLQAAALLLVFFLSSSLFVSYTTVTAYVTVDINPSVELGLNRWGLIVDMKALNDDGQTILPEKKLFRNLDDTVEEIVASAISHGYLTLDKEDENVILLGLSANDNADKWTKDLEDLLEQTSSSVGAGVEVKLVNAGEDKEIRVLASEMDMSLGRYLLYQKVESAVADMDVDQDILIESLGKGGVGGLAKELGVSPSDLVRNSDDKDKLKEVFKPQGLPGETPDQEIEERRAKEEDQEIDEKPVGKPEEIPGQSKGGSKRDAEGEEIGED